MVQQQMAPGFVVQMQEQCDACGGKGKMYKSKCPHCHGNKIVPNEKTLTAHIERGMPSNGEIRFERESEQRCVRRRRRRRDRGLRVLATVQRARACARKLQRTAPRPRRLPLTLFVPRAPPRLPARPPASARASRRAT
jgi:hypothetical protein